MTVEEYITCEKVIDRKRKPALKDEFRHEKMTIELTCPTVNAKMSMFLRRLKDFPEDFTVGLKLDGPNEIMEYDVVLVRFQGRMGDNPSRNQCETCIIPTIFTNIRRMI